MSATRLDELLQGVIDDRKAKGLPAAYRDIEELVKAEEASSPRGLSLNRQTVSEIVTRRYKKTPQEGTLRAIAWLAGVPDEVAFTAAGKRVPGPPFAAELPPGVDELEDDERKAAIAVLRTLVAQRREINRYVDSSTGTKEPRTPRKATSRKKTGEVSTVQRDSGKGSDRRLNVVHSDQSGDDTLRVSYEDDPRSADSTSNVSEQVEGQPVAARRGKGKTKGERLRDRDAQLGEESQDPGGDH